MFSHQLFISRYGPADGEKFKDAQDNFVKSLAAYSVVMWVLMLRDRHNGNLMLDNEGHFFHIDFGFLLGHSTGKQIGGLIECSPFKLTPEFVDLLDGVDSPVYAKFCDACAKAMVACRLHGIVNPSAAMESACMVQDTSILPSISLAVFVSDRWSCHRLPNCISWRHPISRAPYFIHR